MRILCLNWKDMQHPLAGGAELVTEELLQRLSKEHEVVLLTSSFSGATHKEEKDGYTIIRVGGRLSVYWRVYRYYRQHLRGQFDLIIEEVNTVPFFSRFYASEPVMLFIHQLAREIWFYEMSWPLAIIGYLLEPLYLRALSDLPTITVSKSSKADLANSGFNKVSIISEGITLSPAPSLEMIDKATEPVLLSLGAIRSMKRTHHIVEAFEIAKRSLPNLKLVIAGAAPGAYGRKVMARITRSSAKADIHYLGPVDKTTKLRLLASAHVLAVTSVKEGWCLVVTEANSQGTPAVVYNVDGLRDSVRHNETGLITSQNTPISLAESIVALFKRPTHYENLRQAAWQWSKDITFDRSHRDFIKALKLYGY